MDISISPQTGPAAAGLPRQLLRLTYTSDVDGLCDWALALPPDGGGQRWIVCIHGHGSSGEQLYTRADLRARMLPDFLARGYGILTPNLRGNAWMSPAAAADLCGLLAALERQFSVEALVFASGSMGGSSNLIYAALHPEHVAGVIARGAATDVGTYQRWCRTQGASRPILGQIAAAIEAAYGGTPEQVPEVYERHSSLGHAERLRMPLFLAHGTADRTIPVSESRRLVGALAASAAFCYVEIPGGNHDSPLFLETRPSALDWIASCNGW